MHKKDIIKGSAALAELHKEASALSTVVGDGMEAGAKSAGKVKSFFSNLWEGTKDKTHAAASKIDDAWKSEKGLATRKHFGDNRGSYGYLAGGTIGTGSMAYIASNKINEMETSQNAQLEQIRQAVQRQKQMQEQQIGDLNSSWANRGIIDRVLNRPPGQ